MDEPQKDAKWKEPDTRDTHVVWFHLQKISRIGKYMKTDSRLMVGWRRGWEWGVRINGPVWFNCSGEDYYNWLWCVPQVGAFTVSHWIIHSQRINYITCKICLNKVVKEN